MVKDDLNIKCAFVQHVYRVNLANYAPDIASNCVHSGADI
jgi:hypothetical protein